MNQTRGGAEGRRDREVGGRSTRASGEGLEEGGIGRLEVVAGGLQRGAEGGRDRDVRGSTLIRTPRRNSGTCSA